MRKLPIFVFLIVLIMLSGCGTAVPSEVSEYAKRHELEVISAEKLKSSAVVGRDYIVCGTISFINFHNYKKGSSDLQRAISQADDRIKDMVEAELEGTMYYSISFVGGPSMEYDNYNFSFNMLKLNKGDEAAFIVTCEDGYSAGTYSYVIKEKVWENRQSDTTIEEDHDAEEEIE